MREKAKGKVCVWGEGGGEGIQSLTIPTTTTLCR